VTSVSVFAELKERLNEELDYTLEAKNIEAFRDFHASDDYIEIPKVFSELSSTAVLTLEYIEGDSVDSIDRLNYTQSERTQLAHNLFSMLSAQLFEFGTIHGDPHPGNFAFRKDGTIVVYDFGCVKALKPSIVEAYKIAVRSAIDEDYGLLDEALIRLGARVANKPSPGAEYYKVWRDIFFQPFSGVEFNYGASSIHVAAAKNTGLFFKHLELFQPPVDSLYIDRLVSGHYWILKAMGARADFRPALDKYIAD